MNNLTPNNLTTVCVFCGASAGSQPIYVEAAVTLGQELARRQVGLVYGGGSVGLMGVIARTVRDNGSPVVGIIPEHLTTKELMGYPIGELIVVNTMHERKAKMAGLSDAFIALPGGFGTLDELFEAITWGQLGLHTKPIGLLNIAGYFDLLIQYIERAIDEGFIRPHHRQLFVVDEDSSRLLDLLSAHQPPPGSVGPEGLEVA